MERLETINVGGINIVDTSRDELRCLIEKRVDAGREVRLAFCNAHTAEHAFRTPAFLEALNGMLVVNDGIGIEVAARINRGRGFRENLNGTDFVPWFLEHTTSARRIFLLGAKPHVVARVAAIIPERFRQHTVVGARDGYFDQADTGAVLSEIARSRADTLLVAMGNPAQEAFIQAVTARTPVRLFIGVGALFDFLSGETVRAPPLLRRMRLEWLHRLGREPGRLARRYLVGVPYVLGYAVRHRLLQG